MSCRRSRSLFNRAGQVCPGVRLSVGRSAMRMPDQALRPIVLAAHLTMAGTLAAVAAWTPPALAQPAEAGQARRYSIPAGPLNTVLNRLAEEAGVLLAAPGELTAGQLSPGLTGQYGVQAAFSAVLAGSGLEAFRQGDGSFALRRAPTVPAGGENMVLSTVEVKARTAWGGATEGSGRYTSAAPLSTATPLGLTLKETPQSVSVMTSQRIEDQGLTMIQQTLAQVPGVRTGSLGTELGGASARGYSITNYQFDGVNTLVEVLGGGAVPSSTLADMALYDRIEVLRGAAGLVSGPGEPSGTINMVRKKPTAEFQGSVEAGIGSWGDTRTVVDLAGPLNAARSLRGRLIAVGQDADSYIDHYGRQKGLVYGVVEADLTPSTRLTAGVEHERTKVKGQGAYVGFPLWYSDGTRTDLPVSFSAASRDNWLTLRSTKVFATLEQQLRNDWTLRLAGSQARSSHEDGRVFLRFNNHFANAAGDGVLLNASQRDGRIEHGNVDLNLRGPFTLFGRQHELVFGAAYEDYSQPIDSYNDISGLNGTAANLFAWDRTGEGTYGPVTVNSGYVMRQSSLYGAARFQASDRLKLIAGTRVFSHDYRFAEYWDGGSYGTATSEDNVVTPYAGLVYDIDTVHTVYASYTTIYQPQSVRDRNGAVLDPVEGANYEAGVKSSWLDGGLSTAVALYQIRQDNLSEADPGYIVPGTVDTAAHRAVKGAKTTGVDVELSGALSNNWNVSASWAYGQTKNAEGEHTRTTFPRHMVKFWTTYRLPGEWNRLTVGGGANWQSKTYSTVSAWQIGRSLYWEQKAYAVANLMARYDFNEALSATLNVNNVFDKQYIASVSDWWYSGNYGAPRSVALNVKYRF